MIKRFMMISMAMVITLFAHAFTGNGSGTEKDPYQVTNPDELFEVRNDLAAHYIQMNDIDLTEWIKEDNPKQGWNPIGDSAFPFTGSYNGDGKEIRGLYINRPNSDYVGLFGYVIGGTINNLKLKDSKIIGHDYVGIVGLLIEGVISNCIAIHYNIIGNQFVAAMTGYFAKSSVYGNILVLGNVEGHDYVSGIIADYRKGNSDKNTGKESSSVTNNYTHTDILAELSASGIIGKDANDYTYKDDLIITDNVFSGNIIAGKVQGIGGNKGSSHEYWWYCRGTNRRNIVLGNLYGKEAVYGIAASSEGKDILNNICGADTLSVISGDCYRISPYSTQNNYSSITSILIKNGKKIDVEDGNVHGVSYGLKTLKKQSTYEGLGFDFNNHWAIVEGETLPYNIRQSKPATVTSFVSGGKSSISGVAEGTGKVYVKIGQNLYESYVLDGKWEVSLGSVRPGAVALVSVECNGKAPSIVVKAYADRPSGGDTEFKAGDANGDSVIDAADVVSIINHIIGKSSSSFNALNADVNGDGQVLVDDAVAAVELIMNAQ